MASRRLGSTCVSQYPIHLRGCSTGGQRGRRRGNTGGVAFSPAHPELRCLNSSFPEWGTLRIFRAENEVGRLFQQPITIRGWRLAER